MRTLALAVLCASLVHALAACHAGRGSSDGSDLGGPMVLSKPARAGLEDGESTALEALGRSLKAGADMEARGILNSIRARGASKAANPLLAAFERILYGRDAVKSLGLALDCRVANPSDFPTPLPPGSSAWRLALVAHNANTKTLDLRPGPASLTSHRDGVTHTGGEEHSSETRSYPRLEGLLIPPGETREIELARMFIALPSDRLALRLSFEIDLRPGAIFVDGRELPASHLIVAPTEVVRWQDALGPEPIGAEALIAAASAHEDSEGFDPLANAVRVSRAERASALDALGAALAAMPEARFTRWRSALSWLAGEEAPSDALRLRAWLCTRELVRGRVRAEALVLPRVEAPSAAEPATEPASDPAGAEGQSPRATEVHPR